MIEKRTHSTLVKRKSQNFTMNFRDYALLTDECNWKLNGVRPLKLSSNWNVWVCVCVCFAARLLSFLATMRLHEICVAGFYVTLMLLLATYIPMNGTIHSRFDDSSFDKLAPTTSFLFSLHITQKRMCAVSNPLCYISLSVKMLDVCYTLYDICNMMLWNENIIIHEALKLYHWLWWWCAAFAVIRFFAFVSSVLILIHTKQ